MSLLRRAQDQLGGAVSGSYPPLPAPLDRCSDWWSARRPRVRLALALLALSVLVTVTGLRVAAVERRWGGPPQRVLVAAELIPVGAVQLPVEVRRLPPGVVPDDALAQLPPDAVVAMALPRGAVVTRAHLDRQGPGSALPADQRAVPVPVDEGWAVEPGGFADVWRAADHDGAPQLLVEAAPVLGVHEGDLQTVALIGIPERGVAEVAAVAGTGEVLLTHSPAPGQGPP